MKRFIDGNQMCFTLDDFANLQESPAVFVPVSNPEVQAIIREDSLYAASGEFLMNIRQQLVRLTKRAVDLGWTCAKCSCSNIESDLLCGFCDTPRPSH